MNERVDIQFKGLTTSPSDYACGDGELALCNNFVVKDGELAAFFAPDALPMSQTAFSSELDTILCVHRGSGFKNVIMYSSSSDDLKYIRVDDEYNTPDEDGLEFDDNPGEMPLSVETIGNILVFAYESGMRYYRWKKKQDGTYDYVYLGNKLPKIPSITFGLVYNERAVEQHTAGIGDGHMAFSNAVFGALAAAEASANKDGLFSYPFLVRYAYRLYDGSHVMPSAPALMIPLNNSDQLVEISADKLAITHLRAMKLYYRVVEQVALSDWGDIIEGIDIFVTPPFRPHETRKEVTESATGGTNPKHPMGIHNVWTSSGTDPKFPDTIEVSGFQVRELAFEQAHKYAVFASRDQSELVEASTFYHVGFISKNELRETNVARKAPIDYYALETLVNRPILEDEYISHQKVIPENALNYNNRLVISNLSRELYGGQSVLSFFAPCSLDNSHSDENDNAVETYVTIEKNGTEYIVKNLHDRCLDVQRLMDITEGDDRYDLTVLKGRPLLYFFFPDPDAKSVIINIKHGDRNFYATVNLELKRHPTLGGAYWFGGLTRDDYAPFHTGTTQKSPSTDITIKQINSVYISEVNNPFYFPTRYAASVGTGKIMRVAASTRPLSEGQFGEFPLMAFTDEGIWAIAINSEGVPMSVQPISRDVLIRKEALCNLDTAVCFLSKDGVNIIEGSKVTRISDSIRERGVDFDTFVPDAWWDELPLEGEQINFLDGIEHKIPAFSSRWKRIYVFDPNNDVSYTYDIKTGMWSSIKMENVYVQSAVDDYPNTLISGDYNSSNGIYNLNDEADDYRGTTAINRCTANIITRPMRLKMPDMPKTIHEGVIRGYFERRLKDETSVPLPDIDTPTPTSEDGDDADSNQRLPGTIIPGGGTVGGGGSTTEIYTRKVVDCDVRQVLFGSNDLRHWYIVNSSVDQYLRGRFGTPYKWFRLLVVAPSTFDKDKRLTGVTFDVQPRLNNTLR